MRKVAGAAAGCFSGRSFHAPYGDDCTILAAATTSLQQTDRGKVCVITACGGKDRQRWLSLIEPIEAYARGEGCSRVRIFGRKGWLRVLDGYAENHIVLDKELG